MIFDPLYLFVMGLCLMLSFGASLWVKSATSKWSRVSLGRGLTGKDIAMMILAQKGVLGVRIERSKGLLSDHYDPRARVLRLSPGVYDGRSVTAAGIAAHEVGHAVQDAEGYGLMRIRQSMVPIAGLGTNLGIWMVMIGAMIGLSSLAHLGVALFAVFVLFTLITFPIEVDASERAKKALNAGGFLTPTEARGVRTVLLAAAATYLASAVSAVLQLFYWAARAGLLGSRRN